jgi:hypothetical protein
MKTILINIFSLLLLLLFSYRALTSLDLGNKIVCLAFAIIFFAILINSLLRSKLFAKDIDKKIKINSFFRKEVKLKYNKYAWNLSTVCFFMSSCYALLFFLIYGFFDVNNYLYRLPFIKYFFIFLILLFIFGSVYFTYVFIKIFINSDSQGNKRDRIR